MAKENTLQSWTIALTVLLAALFIRWLLWDVAPGRPYFLFYSAVIAAAFYCGWRESYAMIIATTTLALVFNKTSTEGTPPPSVLAVVTGTYIFTVGFVAWGAHVLRDKLRGSLNRQRDLEILNGEMAHRIRNILSIVSVIGAKTIHAGLPPTETAHALHGRLIALSHIYDNFATHSTGARLETLIDKVVCPLSPDSSRIVIHNEGNPLIPYNHATTLTLVLHELATNALKHGAWSTPGGKVILAYASNDKDHVWIEWCERCDNGCKVTTITEEGVGMKLIKRALNGQVEHNIYADGVRCSIEMSLKEAP